MPLAGHATGFPRLRGWLMLAIAALLTACSTHPAFRLTEHTARTTALLLDAVPFFPQTDYHCGPAALAGVLGASGIDINPSTLAPQVYLPQRQGSLQIELLSATRRAGRIAYVPDQQPHALTAELEAGRPVLVLQNLRTRSLPAWHYAVLVGFDPTSNQFVLNTGEQRAARVSTRSFLRTWDWADRWAMVALKPGELPADTNDTRYMEAAAAFESSADAEASLLAWQAASRAWPCHPTPWLAMGNLAYRSGNRQRAAALYRDGLLHNSDDAALNNNLASVLGELSCARTAEALLRPIANALSADNPWKATMATTLQELSARRGTDAQSCRQWKRARVSPDAHQPVNTTSACRVPSPR
jgi:hypothetical protein